jgi:Ca2+-binding EF-hand superfamily protein
LVSKQQRLIEKELLNQTGSKVSEEQLAEFRETFRNFDKDDNGVLEKHEFKACLNALGHNVGNDEAIDRLMKQLCKSNFKNNITSYINLLL